MLSMYIKAHLPAITYISNMKQEPTILDSHYIEIKLYNSVILLDSNQC